jgi:hypothetical protein
VRAVARNAPENRKSRCEIGWRGLAACRRVRPAAGPPSPRLGAAPSARPCRSSNDSASGNSRPPRPWEHDARSSGSKAIPSTRLAHTRGAHMAWIMPSGLTWLFIAACAVTAWVIGYGLGYRRGVSDAINGGVGKPDHRVDCGFCAAPQDFFNQISVHLLPAAPRSAQPDPRDSAVSLGSPALGLLLLGECECQTQLVCVSRLRGASV